jgi:HEAT repeat protein
LDESGSSKATSHAPDLIAEWNQAWALASAALLAGDFQTRWELGKTFTRLLSLIDQTPTALEPAIAPFLTLLNDPTADWELRWFVIRILGELNHPTVVQALAEFLQQADEEDEELYELAATVLANLGKAAIATLTTLLTNDQTRLIAVRALAQIRTPETITPLLTVVNDSQVAIRQISLEALGSFHDPRIPAVLTYALSDVAASVRREAVISLGMRPELAAELNLVRLLRDRLWDFNLEVCQQAAIALGRIGTSDAAEALGKVLQSATTPSVLQVTAIQALSWIEQPIALDYLQPALQLGNPEVQQAIVTALGRMTSPELRPQVAQVLISALQSSPNSPTPAIKQAIALSLGRLGEVIAVEPLVQLLADPEISVQLHAIAALKQLAPESTYQYLQSLATDTTLTPALKQGITFALQEWR